MSIPLDINGTDYQYPEVGDLTWGPDATDWAVAVTTGMLQKAGGLFILLAEVDFGATYGLKSTYFKSRTSDPAAAGALRLANADLISWRNAANSGDLSLSVGPSNELVYNGVPVSTVLSVVDTTTIDLTLTGTALSADIKSVSITNALISASAAIAYSKLNLAASVKNSDMVALTLTNASISNSAAIAYSKLALTGSIVNADVNASAAIAYSKLNLFDSIFDSDISSSAGIDFSKMETYASSRAVVTDGLGFMDVSLTTSTEIGYVKGVTSAIQTQLNAKQASGNYITALTGDVTATGPGSVAGTIANNAVTNAKLAQMATLTIKGNNTGGTANALDLTVSQVNTMLGTLSNPMNAAGQMIYGGASGTPTVVAAGTSGQYLKSNGTSAPTFTSFVAPTIQKFTSGSGTYTTPAGVRYINVRMVGGGGGGCGSGTSAGTAAGSGGNTTFGTTLLVANGGTGAAWQGVGPAGGTASLGTAIGLAFDGATGGGYSANLISGSSQLAGAAGGSTPFGGAGGCTPGAGIAAKTNTGSGGSGGGAGTSANNYAGTGGGAGGYVDALIFPTALATYSYAVGAAGSAGGAGGGAASAGGAGAAGIIIVTEYY